MNNDVLLVPITVEQPNVEAQSDVVVYVPQAHKNKAGIVKEGDGIIIENGVASLDKTLVQDMVDAVDEALTDEISDVDGKIVAHINDFDNPHRVTKSQIGLSNVDNTSDENKPISNATQRELKRLERMISGEKGALAYATYEEMVTALNADEKSYGVGQSVFIGTRDVPDLWIYGVEDTKIEYIYVDDNTIELTLKYDGTIRIGYYTLAALESNVVELDNVVTTDTEQTITASKNFTGNLLYNGAEVATSDEIYDNFISYTTVQDLTEAQKEQVRNNIGAGTGTTVIIDAELNAESENPVQNKVVTQELDNRYTKEEVDDLIGDIETGGGTSVEIVWWED